MFAKLTNSKITVNGNEFLIQNEYDVELYYRINKILSQHHWRTLHKNSYILFARPVAPRKESFCAGDTKDTETQNTHVIGKVSLFRLSFQDSSRRCNWSGEWCMEHFWFLMLRQQTSNDHTIRDCSKNTTTSCWEKKNETSALHRNDCPINGDNGTENYSVDYKRVVTISVDNYEVLRV